MEITAQQIQNIIAHTVREELAKVGIIDPGARKIFTVKEASKMLKVSIESIYKMVDDGRINAIDLSIVPEKNNGPKKRHKRSFRISESEIKRLTETRIIAKK